jgi:subtilisin-like proprotein convertase family protein
LSLTVGEATPPETITKEVIADLLIPDNQPEGVYSGVTLDALGKAKAIRVFVDVIHPWIGDLEIRLVPPSGEAALLRGKTGGSQDDIHETYDSADHENLSKLLGGEVAGEWKLHVRDLARRDTGRLNRWSIEIDLGPVGKTIELKSTPQRAIPDMARVTDSLTVPESGSLTSVEVAVNISHSYAGDLVVRLSAPSGHTVTLQQDTGQPGTDLRQTFTAQTTSELSLLAGEQVSGDWTLDVADMARFDEGTLEDWTLRIAYQ